MERVRQVVTDSDRQLFKTDDPKTIELALVLVEQSSDKVLHEWCSAIDGSIGKWIAKHCLFYLVMTETEFRGYACLIWYEDGVYIHFGTTGKTYAAKDLIFGLNEVSQLLKNYYNVTELKCIVHDQLIVRLITRLGFKSIDDDHFSYQIL